MFLVSPSSVRSDDAKPAAVILDHVVISYSPHHCVGFLFLDCPPTSLLPTPLLTHPSHPPIIHHLSTLPLCIHTQHTQHIQRTTHTQHTQHTHNPHDTRNMYNTHHTHSITRLRKSRTPLNCSLWKALLDAARAKRSQSYGAAPEESNATKRAVSGRVCWMRRARKGPRALGRLRKSLTPLNALSLEGSVGCGAREKVPELCGCSGRV